MAAKNNLTMTSISTHAPAGGATGGYMAEGLGQGFISTHAPAGGATRSRIITSAISSHFYSRPCGRGDPGAL